MLSRKLRQCSSTSLAYTSSFCCTSPWTFVMPCEPRMSPRPARRTWAWISLVASVMPDSSQENSPDAPGNRLLLLQNMLLGRHDGFVIQPCQRLAKGFPRFRFRRESVRVAHVARSSS